MRDLTSIEQELARYLAACWLDVSWPLPSEFFVVLNSLGAPLRTFIVTEIAALRESSSYREQFPDQEAYRASLESRIKEHPPAQGEELQVIPLPDSPASNTYPSRQVEAAERAGEKSMNSGSSEDEIKQLGKYILWALEAMCTTGKEPASLESLLRQIRQVDDSGGQITRLFEDTRITLRNSAYRRQIGNIRVFMYDLRKQFSTELQRLEPYWAPLRLRREQEARAIEQARVKAKAQAYLNPLLEHGYQRMSDADLIATSERLEQSFELRSVLRDEFASLGNYSVSTTLREERITIAVRRIDIARLIGFPANSTSFACWNCRTPMYKDLNAVCPTCGTYICSGGHCARDCQEWRVELRGVYSSRCWKCSAPVNTKVNPICPNCHWCVCRCGACGCHYPGNIGFEYEGGR